ncbi:unnamed protein product, partial [Pocillopora meandrina]
MYTSADANDSTEEQALTSIQEFFKAVSFEKEADKSMHPSGNSYRSDVEPVPLPGHDHKTYQRIIIIDNSSFLFETSSEEAKYKKSGVICEIGKDSIRLLNGRLELTEERLCQVLSDCRGECDLEKNETKENQ